MMFFRSFGRPKPRKTKTHPKRLDCRLRLERLENKALLAVVLPSLATGSQYQLVVATSLTTSSNQADIAWYNNLASIAGSNISSVPAATWKAWVSTPTTHAADNVPLYGSVPIYNTNGQLVASGQSGFLSPVHQAPILSETGDPLPGAGVVWTGSNYAGLGLGSGSLGFFADRSFYGVGQSNSYTTSGLWASSGMEWNADPFGIYIISSAITAGSSATTPAAPTSISGIPGNSQVLLTWTAPSNNGGSPITDYTIEYSNDGGELWTNFPHTASTATTAAVTGLANGTSYVFRVAAVNAAGTGNWSASSANVTPRTVPATPISLIGTAGNGQVILSWTAPSSSGGSPVTDYIINFRSDGGTEWSTFPHTGSTATTATVTGLTNGTSYVFRVAAVNAAGAGGWSLDSSPTTPYVDTVFPYVVSMFVIGPNPTNATTISYSVRFSEHVTGVDATDFLTVTSGLNAVGPIVVAGSGTSYTVTVSNITGSGSLALQLRDNGTIRDHAGNPLTSKQADKGFLSHSLFNTGYNPTYLDIGDVNDDGNLDIVVTNSTQEGWGTRLPAAAAHSVSVLLGNGTGSFSAGSYIAVGKMPRGIKLVDLNSDGKLDMVVANQTDNTIHVLLGHGDGGFRLQATLATGKWPTAVVATDFNGDGKMDIAVATRGNVIDIFAGVGDGSFSSAKTTGSGLDSWSLAVGDVNQDGNADLVVGGSGPFSVLDSISLLLGKGDGTFLPSVSLDGNASAFAIVLGDLNGDGNLDIAFTNNDDPGTVSVLLGKGDGAFGVGATYATGAYPVGLAIGDVNSDGISDLVVSNFMGVDGNSDGTSISVLLGLGDGTFQTQAVHATGLNPVGVQIADINHDGMPDVVVTNATLGYDDGAFGGSISVLLNSFRGDFIGDSVVVSQLLSPPMSLIGIPGNSQALLTWTAPSSNGGSPITDYTIEYSNDGGELWINFPHTASTATTAAVTGLANGTDYVFRVAAMNAAGTGNWSASSATVTPRTVPAAPISLIGTPGNGQVILSWTAPSSSGGSPVTDYIIDYKSNGGTEWSPFPHAASTATTATVTGLTNGTSYVFRVAAVNAAGAGEYLEPIALIPEGVPDAPPPPTAAADPMGISDIEIPGNLPSPPITVNAVPVEGGVLVWWGYTPANPVIPSDPKKPWINHDVEYSSDGTIWTAVIHTPSSSPFQYVPISLDVKALIFRVRGINGYGVGRYGYSSNYVIPGTVASPALQYITLAAPAGDGGRPIIGYKVQISYDSGTTWKTAKSGGPSSHYPQSLTPISELFNYASPARDNRITVLDWDRPFVLRSAAINQLGMSPWSLPSDIFNKGSAPTPKAPPTASVAVSNGTLIVSLSQGSQDGIAVFTRKAGDGSWSVSDVRYYDLRYYDTTQFVVPNLAAGLTYDIKVQALNRWGLSVPYSELTVGIPYLPNILSTTPGNGSVSVTWTGPVGDGGSPVTDYIINYSINGGETWTPYTDGTSTATNTVISGLANGTSYVFRVAAVNAGGTGAWSSYSAAVTPRTVATAPTSPIGTPGNGQVTLSWTAPSNNGGSPVTDYTIQYSSNGGATWTPYTDGTSTATNTVITGLANGTSYVFRMAAVNAGGIGGFSNPTPRVTPLAAAPGRPSGSAGNGFVVLRWAAPRLVRMPRITDYVIRYSVNSGATWNVYPHTASAATSRRVLLANGNTYIFQVAPVVSGGVGVFSASSLPVTPYSPAAKPVAPTGVVGVKAGALIALSWNPVPGNAGGPVRDYVVQYRLNRPNTRWWTYRDLVSPATSASIRLRADNTYVFRVAARNSAGVGAYSAQSAPVTALLATITLPTSSPLRISSGYPRPVQRADR